MAEDVIITKVQMVRLLENYREERESISYLLDHLNQDIEGFYQPSQISIDEVGVKVQKQYNHNKQIDMMLARCNEARHYQKKTLLELRDRTELLDRLMYCLSTIPGDKRALITEVVMNGEQCKDLADRTGRSAKQVARDRDQAIEHLYSKLTKRRIESGPNNEQI